MKSYDYLARRAERRKEIFSNLNNILASLKKTVKEEIDSESKVFLLGSVAKGEYTFSSDIDILILTKANPAEAIAILRRKGFEDPFQFHIADEERFEWYESHAKEIREI